MTPAGRSAQGRHNVGNHHVKRQDEGETEKFLTRRG
jgi:hypothetical protein